MTDLHSAAVRPAALQLKGKSHGLFIDTAEYIEKARKALA